MRLTIDQAFMAMAQIVAGRSTCSRLQVGCIITNQAKTSILSMGYNGNYAGGPNECDSDEPGACGCLHAEDNALVKFPYGTPAVMYCTHTPCLTCAKRIINAGITVVHAGQLYRDVRPVQLLVDNNVTVIMK